MAAKCPWFFLSKRMDLPRPFNTAETLKQEGSEHGGPYHGVTLLELSLHPRLNPSFHLRKGSPMHRAPLFLLACLVAGYTAPLAAAEFTLLATPNTVAWGYYSGL